MTPTAKSLPAWVDRLRDLLTANMKENKDLISYALATMSANDAQQPRVSPRCFAFLSVDRRVPCNELFARGD